VFRRKRAFRSLGRTVKQESGARKAEARSFGNLPPKCGLWAHKKGKGDPGLCPNGKKEIVARLHQGSRKEKG